MFLATVTVNKDEYLRVINMDGHDFTNHIEQMLVILHDVLNYLHFGHTKVP